MRRGGELINGGINDIHGSPRSRFHFCLRIIVIITEDVSRNSIIKKERKNAAFESMQEIFKK